MKIKPPGPLGSECEEIKDNQIYRCRWYIALKGKDPQSEKDIDEWGCAMSWLPVLLIENAQTNRGQTQAIESFRNEVGKNQGILNMLFSNGLKKIGQ